MTLTPAELRSTLRYYEISTAIKLAKAEIDQVRAERALAVQALESLVSILHAANLQRSPSDDQIIAVHIADALDITCTALRELKMSRIRARRPS